MKYKFPLGFILFMTGYYSLHAGQHVVQQQFIKQKGWNFVENKGQLASPDIKYYGHQSGVSLYCKSGIISFAFTKIESKNTNQISEATSQPSMSTSPLQSLPVWQTGGVVGFYSERETERGRTITSRVDLILLNSNPTAQIIASNQQEYYENYYIKGSADNGITHVHSYKTITYKSIYPHIDMVLHAREKGMKYEFMVYPGGNVSDIQIQWNGLEKIEKNQYEGMEYSLALGKIVENNAVSFQGGTKINSAFVRHYNRISFRIHQYDKTKPLLIDPTLVWSTYFEGNSNSFFGITVGNGVATDNAGNVYMLAFTDCNSLATSGAYQTSRGGNICLAKFNSKGNILWATYYSGYGQSTGDLGHGLATDPSGNVYITGYTQSILGITTSGTYQTDFGGGYSDAFLAKFSSNGNIIWATYYGGSDKDEASSVATDHLGNVYISGQTFSNNNIATAGAYRTSNTGKGDAFIAKFDSIGHIQWGTYFGSSNSEATTGTAVDVSGNVYIQGTTSSTSGIATKGAYKTSNSGGKFGLDAFIAKFNTSGQVQWATYYGGSGDENSYGIALDGLGNSYVAGTTKSASGIATNGAFQTSYRGIYLASFSDLGKMRWSTYYGSTNGYTYYPTPSIELQEVGVTTDGSGDVYIAGITDSSAIMTTVGAYQTSFAGGGADGFLAKFSNTGHQQWASYFGGPDEDNCRSVACEKNGDVFITGGTESNSGIASTGANQSSYGGKQNNPLDEAAFLAKFIIPNYDAGIDSFVSPISSSCKDTLPVAVLLKNFGHHEIDSVRVSFSLNGQLQPSYYWTGILSPDSGTIINIGNFNLSSGTNILKAWTSYPNGVLDSFPPNDTALTNFVVYPLPKVNAGPDTILCYNEVYTMKGSGGISYTWHPAKYLSSATDPNAKAILPNTEQYELIVSNVIGCSDSAAVLLKVRPKLKVKAFALNNTGCYGENGFLNARGSGGDSAHYSFTWPKDSLKGDSIHKKLFASGWHEVILSDNCTPDTATDSIYMSILAEPKAAFTWSPSQNIIQRHPVSFLNRSTNATTYIWDFGTGDSSNFVSPVHTFADTGTYRILLIAINQAQCPADTTYGTINIISDQVNIFIPNAFSPNNDGINDLFIISGIGIKTYSYNIYNQWGEHIFETSQLLVPSLADKDNTGWNGTFKGKPAPEGVYIYKSDVTDITGIHHYLSGNIMLLR